MSTVVTAEVVVEATPDHAFSIFVDEIGLWWRTGTRYWNDAERGQAIRIEPWVGGRFLEVHDLDTGEGFEVGRVTVYEPGRRLALTWTQVGWPDGAHTDIEITFTPTADGTQVRLAQSGFERIPGAESFLGGYSAGWNDVLGYFAELTQERRSA